MPDITGDTNLNLNTEPAQVDKAATEPAEKMLTQSQFNTALQDRLAQQNAKHAKELEKAKQEYLSEGQKMAKMSADERDKHEFEQKLKALEEREMALTKGELKAQAKSVLIEKDMPIELAEYLPFTDAENTMNMLGVIEKGFRMAVEKAVTERLKGNPPKVGQNVPPLAEVDKLTAQYEAAIKAGNTVEAVALKNKLFKLEQK